MEDILMYEQKLFGIYMPTSESKTIIIEQT